MEYQIVRAGLRAFLIFGDYLIIIFIMHYWVEYVMWVIIRTNLWIYILEIMFTAYDLMAPSWNSTSQMIYLSSVFWSKVPICFPLRTFDCTLKFSSFNPYNWGRSTSSRINISDKLFSYNFYLLIQLGTSQGYL